MLIYKVIDPQSADGKILHLVSFLTPEQINDFAGLPPQAIAGVIEPFSDDTSTWLRHFSRNPVFVRYMHHIIKTFCPDDPSFQIAARQQKEGYVYVIDLRTPEGPLGNVPSHDIIGAFDVNHGMVLSESYKPFEAHRILSPQGLVKLPPFLHEAFIRELKTISPDAFTS